MTGLRQIIIEIPDALASEVDAEIASGAYSSFSQLVTDSVQERRHPTRYNGSDARIERWLAEVVGPTYDAYKADPTELLSEDEAFRMLDERAAARIAKT